MCKDVGARRARKSLSSDVEAEKIVSILEQFEVKDNGGFFAETTLYESAKTSVANKRLDLTTFSCLGSFKGKEELRPGLFDTFFFKDKEKRLRMTALLEALNKICPSVFSILTVFLPDMEPRRTWGWSVPQDEISLSCEIMKDEGVEKVYPHMKVRLWSEVDGKDEFTWQDALNWIHNPAQVKSQALTISQETEHLKIFQDISLPLGFQETARVQVAAYAREGLILHRIFPHGILVQSEYPVERKDQMFQSLLARESIPSSLPVIHPFSF